MLRQLFVLPAFSAFCLAGAASGNAQAPSYPLADAPDHLKPAIERAETVFSELQKGLLTTLLAELKNGGPTEALSVCHVEAAPIARRVAAENGILIGRTSHRLRNAANEPPEWARAHVASPASPRAGDARAIAIDLGDRVGVLKPIATVALCANCHGPRDALAPDVRERLRNLYPRDEAVDFQEGDLRGWMWAEVPLTR